MYTRINKSDPVSHVLYCIINLKVRRREAEDIFTVSWCLLYYHGVFFFFLLNHKTIYKLKPRILHLR